MESPQFRGMFAGGSCGILLEVFFSFPLFLKMKSTLEEKDWQLKCTDEQGEYELEIPLSCRNPTLWTFAKGDCGFVLRSRLSNTEKDCVRISLEVRQKDSFPRVTGRAIFSNNSKKKLDKYGQPTNIEKSSHHAIHHNFFTTTDVFEKLSSLNKIQQGKTLTNNRLFLTQMFIEGLETAATIFGCTVSSADLMHHVADDEFSDYLTKVLRHAGDQNKDYFIVSPTTKFLLSAVLKLLRKKEGTAHDFEPSFFELAANCSTDRFPTFGDEVQDWCTDLEDMESLMYSHHQVPFPTVLRLARSSKVKSLFGLVNWIVANLQLVQNFRCDHEYFIPDLDFLDWWQPVKSIVRLSIECAMNYARKNFPVHFILRIKKTRRFSVYNFDNL